MNTLPLMRFTSNLEPYAEKYTERISIDKYSDSCPIDWMRPSTQIGP
jgi:hypothetical protein